MDGLFIVALTVLLIGGAFLGGFGITAAAILLIKGTDAARRFIEEEW